MSVPRRLAIFMLIYPFGTGALAIEEVYAQTNTGARQPAKPKATPPVKRAPVRRPPPPTQVPAGSFSVPQVEEDNWYDVDFEKTFGSTEGSTQQQAGAVLAVNYFGSGAGAEYIYNFPHFSVGGTFLYTIAKLEDNLTADGDSQGEAKEFFDTKTIHLKAHARYRFFRYVYVGGGLSFDRITGDYGWRGSAINGGELDTTFSANIPTLDLFVGTEFKGPWGLYFGADWIGTSIPLGGTVKYSRDTDVELTTRALKDASPNQRIDDETSAQLKIYYLNFRIGKTF